MPLTHFCASTSFAKPMTAEYLCQLVVRVLRGQCDPNLGSGGVRRTGGRPSQFADHCSLALRAYSTGRSARCFTPQRTICRALRASRPRPGRGDRTGLRKRVAAGLVELVMSGLCAVSSAGPLVCAHLGFSSAPAPGRLLRATPLLARRPRASATRRSRSEPAPAPLPPAARRTRTRADLIAYALGLVDSGELTISGPDGPVADRASLVEGLGQVTDACLADLLRLALLEGDSPLSGAWRDEF